MAKEPHTPRQKSLEARDEHDDHARSLVYDLAFQDSPWAVPLSEAHAGDAACAAGHR